MGEAGAQEHWAGGDRALILEGDQADHCLRCGHLRLVRAWASSATVAVRLVIVDQAIVAHESPLDVSLSRGLFTNNKGRVARAPEAAQGLSPYWDGFCSSPRQWATP